MLRVPHLAFFARACPELVEGTYALAGSAANASVCSDASSLHRSFVGSPWLSPRTPLPQDDKAEGAAAINHANKSRGDCHPERNLSRAKRVTYGVEGSLPANATAGFARHS